MMMFARGRQFGAALSLILLSIVSSILTSILTSIIPLTLACAGALVSERVIAAERGPLLTQRTQRTEEAVETEARVIVKYKVDSGLMRALSVSAAALSASASNKSATPTSVVAALPQHAGTLSSRLGLQLTDGRMLGPRSQVLRAKGLSSRELADRLSAQGDVEYAVIDGRKRAFAVPNDPLYAAGQLPPTTPAAGQWYLRAPASALILDPTTVVASINAEAAWNITAGKRRIVVADIDTGVRFDHPDLASKLLPGYDFIVNAGTANDGNARDADPSDPGDYVTQEDITSGLPGCTQADVGDLSSWHGTQTAGLIGAATNNGIGMASVGHDVMVLPLRVLGKCGGFDSDIQAAMLWAVGIAVPGLPTNATPAKVLNLSLGSKSTCSPGYADAVAQVTAAGAVIVAASGNLGLAVGEPANCPGVIAVVGVRQAGTKVGYSNLGPNAAIAAPAGNCVNTAQSSACLFPLLTTTNTGATAPTLGAIGAAYTNGDSDPSLGTSFSSPLVAGTVALMFSANASLTPAAVLDALQSTARPFPTSGSDPGVSVCTAPSATAQNAECYCTTATCGAGLLDAGLAVAKVAALNANIDVSSTTVVVGSVVSLDGSASNAAAGHSIASYQWSISGGQGLASITSGNNASTITISTTGLGTVTVNLTVVDDAGQQAATSLALSVVSTLPLAAPTAVAPATSGGGGAMRLGWLLAWAGSVFMLWLVGRRAVPR